MNNLPQSIFDEAFGGAGYRLWGNYTAYGLERFFGMLTQPDFIKFTNALQSYYYAQ